MAKSLVATGARTTHNRDAWAVLTDDERSAANVGRKPGAPAPVRVYRERNAHPFGRRPLRKSRPCGGYVDPGTVAGTPWYDTGGRPTTERASDPVPAAPVTSSLRARSAA
jgi:hypothetical protein